MHSSAHRVSVLRGFPPAILRACEVRMHVPLVDTGMGTSPAHRLGCRLVALDSIQLSASEDACVASQSVMRLRACTVDGESPIYGSGTPPRGRVKPCSRGPRVVRLTDCSAASASSLAQISPDAYV